MAENIDADGEEIASDEIRELRRRFLDERRKEINGGTYDRRDVDRFEKDDHYVGLFLKSRYGNVGDALTAVHTSLEWRKQFAIADVREEDLRPQFESGLLYFHGRDREGRAILWFVGRLHRRDASQLDAHKRLLAHHFERHCAENPREQLVVAMDMHGAGLANLDMDLVSFMVSCFETLFPHMLAYLIVYDLPWMLQAAWRIVRSWLDPRGVDVVKVVGRKEIVSYFDAENRPEHMGGVDAFRFVYRGPEERRKVTFADSFDDTAQSAAADAANVEYSTPANENPPPFPGFDGAAAPPTGARRRGRRKSVTGPLLVISPGTELELATDNAADSSEAITLTNRSEKAVAFKVKITSPQKYRVRPSSGVIQPGASADVTVSLQSGFSSVARDKFLIMSTELEERQPSADGLAAAWNNASSVFKHRLHCRARPIADDAVLPLDRQVSKLTDQMS
ncbi:PREDICTED: motile sperm domain-containing protein 2-like [Priapulus caudatus]|uniref:Motile sperm domain-containing protein 2-like n=1 Tax=Priapulus caudatus TaxID=37621 RepID=A0ABM1EQQ7_PRICU|nr:PREDICTED: motile sperm domain-containing protein 2-like [Priapulus caudatus]XP_014674529.1 PREDICTED: motile sperm domain-containing protein 2-like [Priapulus caudatus]